MKTYKLKNIHLSGNEHGQLASNTIYAELHDQDGVCISATLDYVLQAIRDRGLKVEGVGVEYNEARGAVCSTVSLLKYD